jgi:hypothetical protein
MKFLSLTLALLTLSLTAIAQVGNGPGNNVDDWRPCTYSCSISQKIGNQDSVIVSPLEEVRKFKPIGGYTHLMNTSCMFKGRINDVLITSHVSDSFGYSTELTIQVEDDYVVSEGAGNKGKYSVTNGKYKLECIGQ